MIRERQTESAGSGEPPTVAKQRWFASSVFVPFTIFLLASILAGYFLNQGLYHETYHEEPRYFAYPWATEWIEGTNTTSCNACFRKVVYVGSDVKRAYLVVAAGKYYDLQVNGNIVTPFFGENPTIGNLTGGVETPDTIVGNDEQTNVALIYNIQQFLTPGRNVITAHVQTDEGIPRFAVQGVIESNVPQIVASDSTWTFSDHQEFQDGVSWRDLGFDDSTWNHVVTTGNPVDELVEGDYTMLDHPLNAAFINNGGQDFDSPCTVSKTFYCPSGPSYGWMRIITAVPYDLTLNGNLIYSSNTAARGLNAPFSRFDIHYHIMDALPRTQNTPTIIPDPKVTESASLSLFPMSNMLLPGEDTITVSLHPLPAVHGLTVPAVYIDGQESFSHGQQLQITSDQSWQAHVGIGGDWQPASVYSTPPSDIYNLFGNWHLLTYLSNSAAFRTRVVTNATCICCLLIPLSFIIALVLSGAEDTLATVLAYASYLSLCPLCLMIGILCAQIVSPFTAQDTFWSEPAIGWGTLALAFLLYAVSAVTLAANRSVIKPSPDESDSTAAQHENRSFRDKYGYALCLIAIILAAAVVYTRHVDANPFLNDEYVSLLCSRGILRTGIPIYQHSGIIYGRSSLYHYLLVPFLAYGIANNDIYVTRYLSAIWQLLSIPVVYLLTRNLKGRPAALAAALLVAFSPAMVFYARETRFYAQYAFFFVLTFYLLLRALQEPKRLDLKFQAIAAYCGAFLSQELAMTMVPSILLLILLSRQLKDWMQSKVLVALGVTLVIIFLDFYVYFKFCETPLPNVDRDALPLLAFHPDHLELSSSFLLTGPERTQLPFGLLFCLGFAGIIAKFLRIGGGNSNAGSVKVVEPPPFQWKWWSYLYVVALPSVVANTVLIPITGLRYVVGIIPILIIISVCVAASGADKLIRHFDRLKGVAPRLISTAVACAYLIACIAAYHPFRLWNATTRKVNRDHTGAAQFIESHREPGDKVMFADPQAAMVEFDQCDYYYSTTMKSLYKYESSDGRLRERNTGAIVIDTSAKLNAVLAQNPRVWLMTTPFTEDKDLAEDVFAEENFEIVYESYGIEVWLWDRSRNHYVTPDLSEPEDQTHS